MGLFNSVYTQLYEHLKNDERIGEVHTMNYYAFDNRVIRIHIYTCEGDDTFQEKGEEGE